MGNKPLEKTVRYLDTCSRKNVLKSLDPKVMQGAKAGTIPSSIEMLFSEDITHVQRLNHAG